MSSLVWETSCLHPGPSSCLEGNTVQLKVATELNWKLKGVNTVNSGELRILFRFPCKGKLWFVFAIGCNIKPLNFTNHKCHITQTGNGTWDSKFS